MLQGIIRGCGMHVHSEADLSSSGAVCAPLQQDFGIYGELLDRRRLEAIYQDTVAV